nr:MAG TPA: FN3 [Caudoviricetes sp.]
MAAYDLTKTKPGKIQTGDILNCPYSGAAVQITLPGGRYRLECWGAQGGYRSSSSYGGKGGFSTGELTLAGPAALYLYTGGSGSTGKTAGGFNGGGKRSTYNGGGGASDIRIGQDSLNARVMVAGGGGSDGASNKAGGYGGGANGEARTDSYGTGGYSGTQTGVSSSSWQTGTVPTSLTTQAGAYAGFGFGGNGINRSSGYGGAGGGGWYGGSGAYPDSSGDDDRGGGGGSGFVWTGSNAPSGYLLDAGHYLTNASTAAGNSTFAAPGGGTETGHAGDGYVRVTALEVFPTVPDTPGNFRQTSQEYFSIGLAWDAVEAAGYRLYRDGTLISTQAGTTYTDSGLQPNRPYLYTLTAYNSDGDSEPALLQAKTKEGYALLQPVIESAAFSSNPAAINQKITLTVKASELLKILQPEVWGSGEIYSGEV